MLSDPIADMLTRIRNASRAGKKTVNIKASKICLGIAGVLKEEGFIGDCDKIDDATGQGILRISLKYSIEGIPVISDIQRKSRPGKRIYSPVDQLSHVLGGMGITIVSTSKGVMTDKSCRNANLGGELICTVS